MDKRIEHYLESFKVKGKEFIHNLNQEGEETKEAFNLLIDSIESGRNLTDEEKHQIGEQLKDVLKTVGVVSIAMLPGGSVFFYFDYLFQT